MLQITAENFLEVKGYSQEEWILLDPKTSKLFLSQSKASVKMYPVEDRKSISAMGKGYHLTSLPWYNELKDSVLVEEKTMPTPKAPKPKEEKKLVMIDTNFTKEQYLESGWTEQMLVDNGKAKWEESKTIAAPKAPTAPKPAPAPITVDEIKGFMCSQEPQTGERCENQCEDCKDTVEDKEVFDKDIQAQEIEVARQEAAETPIEKIVAPKDVEKKSDAPTGLTLERKIGLVEKNLGMVRKDYKMVHEGVDMHIPINLLENMTDEKFNSVMVDYVDILNRKKKTKNVANQLGCKIVGKVLNHEATSSTISINEFENLEGSELEIFIENAKNDIEENLQLSGKMKAEEAKVEKAPTPTPAPAPKPKAEKVVKLEPKKAAEKVKEEKKAPASTPKPITDDKDKGEMNIPQSSERVSSNFEVVDSFVSILSRYKQIEFAIADMKAISEKGGRNTLKDIKDVLNKL